MQRKKRYLITGGTSGVGKSIATAVAQTGGELTLLGRDMLKGENTVKELKEKTGNHAIQFFSVDISSARQLVQFIKIFKQKYDYLDVLINTAGGIVNNYQLTEENIEMNWALNYLSHYTLSQGLIELLKNSKIARILTVAGHPSLLKHTKPALHYMATSEHFNGMKAASQAALARVGLTLLLADQLKNSNIAVQAFYPGEIKSELAKAVKFPINIPLFILQIFAKKGCTIGQYLAVTEKTQTNSGVFFNAKGEYVSLNNIVDDSFLHELDRLSKEQTSIINSFLTNIRN